MTGIEIDRAYLQQTAVNLVRINSVNPTLSPDGAGEGEISAYVADELAAMGLAVERYEVAPGRWNVIGTLKGRGNGRTLLWNAHMDTVGVAGMANPFGGEVVNGRLYGRGAQDMKGSLAAMLAAAKALVDSGVTVQGDLLVTAVADEEAHSIGAAEMTARVHADAAIVTEPTDLTLTRAHRGFVWLKVETLGRQAHGSRYTEGIDANIRMGRFLARLEQLEQALRQRKGHELTGPPSLHVALLRGGQEISMYAGKSTAHIERRTVPGETAAQVTAEIQTILDELAVDETFQATLEVAFSRPPLAVPANRPVVRCLSEAAARRLGAAPLHTGQTFWTDAALFAAAGMDAVLMGPVGAGLHALEEWVDLDSVLDLSVILAETAVLFCN